MGKQALHKNISVHGQDNKHTTRLQIIGGVLYFKGDKYESMRLHEEALEIRKNVPGPYHKDTASSINQIAFI